MVGKPGARGRHVDLHTRCPPEGHRAMDGAARLDRAPLRLLADHAVGAGAALYAAGAMVLRGLVARRRPGERLDDLARARALDSAPPLRHTAHGLRLRARPDRLPHHRRPLLPDGAGRRAPGPTLARLVAEGLV